MCTKLRSLSGATLVELVIFILIVSIAVVGILQVMNLVTGHSADALVQKQAQAIAESMLEEIELKDFSPTAGFTPANRSQYVAVTDYSGYSTSSGIVSPDNDPITGLGGYNLSVTVSNTALGTIPSTDAVFITVTVTGPGNFKAVAQGYRSSAL